MPVSVLMGNMTILSYDNADWDVSDHQYGGKE